MKALMCLIELLTFILVLRRGGLGVSSQGCRCVLKSLELGGLEQVPSKHVYWKRTVPAIHGL